MPYKSQKIILPSKFDRRIKIPKSEHKAIKQAYKQGEAIRAIARRYKVDKRLIQFILFPERQKLNYIHRLERGGSKQYYNKDKWRETQKEHRSYKQKLYLQGKI